jgi:Mn2+/Fe2+ NRAMP family transporter
MEAQVGALKSLVRRGIVRQWRARLKVGWRARIAIIVAVVGPGIITANVDNDAGGITTYSLAGAQFGYALLWTLIPITVALVVIQEMCAYVNSRTYNVIAWSSSVIMIVLTLLMVGSLLVGTA